MLTKAAIFLQQSKAATFTKQKLQTIKNQLDNCSNENHLSGLSRQQSGNNDKNRI